VICWANLRVPSANAVTLGQLPGVLLHPHAATGQVDVRPSGVIRHPLRMTFDALRCLQQELPKISTVHLLASQKLRHRRAMHDR
jgi:hypothetical protein